MRRLEREMAKKSKKDVKRRDGDDLGATSEASTEPSKDDVEAYAEATNAYEHTASGLARRAAKYSDAGTTESEVHAHDFSYKIGRAHV